MIPGGLHALTPGRACSPVQLQDELGGPPNGWPVGDILHRSISPGGNVLDQVAAQESS
jgi:hypothetical protein